MPTILILEHGPWIVAALAAVTTLVALLVPLPSEWVSDVALVARIGTGLAFMTADIVFLRAWGVVKLALLVPAGLCAVLILGSVTQSTGSTAPIVTAGSQALMLVALMAIAARPRLLADRLPRRREWEVLHRISIITAIADPLSQEEAVDQAPRFLAVIVDVRRYRTAATAEYLSLFEEHARFDLRVGPAPSDPEALNRRWQVLHRALAAQLEPYRAWEARAPATAETG